MDNIAIFRVMIKDLDDLVLISRQTYFETFFDAFNDPAAFEVYIAEVYAAERLRKELQDVDTRFYFAANPQGILGYYKLNFRTAQSIFRGNNAAEIERIYVLADHQAKGIGTALLRHAIAEAGSEEIKDLWLAVWDQNHQAITFYKRNGWRRFGTHNYIINKELQTDILLHFDPDVL